MRIDDDSVSAYHATRELIALYDAYRATTRAQVVAFRQMLRILSEPDRMPDPQRPARLAEVRTQEALTRHIDAVFAQRTAQLLERLAEIRDSNG
jgi:hypothetical protein